MDWRFVYPYPHTKKKSCWNLIPNVMVFWSWIYRRLFGYKGRAPMNGISALIRKAKELAHSLPTMWGCKEKLAVHRTEEGSRQNPIILPASRIVRNAFLLGQPASFWYFVLAAWADYSTGVGWTLNPMTGVFIRIRRGRFTHRDTDTEGRRPGGDSGGDGSTSATSQGTPIITRNPH